MYPNKQLPLLPSDAANIPATRTVRLKDKHLGAGSKPFPRADSESHQTFQQGPSQRSPREDEPPAGRPRAKSMKKFFEKIKTITSRRPGLPPAPSPVLDPKAVVPDEVHSEPDSDCELDPETCPIYFCLDTDVEWTGSSMTLANREDPFSNLMCKRQYKCGHYCPSSVHKQSTSPSSAANKGARGLTRSKTLPR